LALASLVAQTYANWECILVDDGSTDRPIALVEAASDARIRYFRFEKNMGRGAARQCALDLASGDYLAMLDADDWIYPQKLQRQLQVMEASPDIAVLSAGMAIVDRDNEIVGTRTPGSNQSGLSVFRPLSQPKPLPIAHATCMIRMDVAKQTKYDTGFRLSEDNDYLLRILLRHPYGVLSEITYAYTEFESVTLDKIIPSLRNNRQMLAKYRDEYASSTYVPDAKLVLKELFYRLGFALGQGERLIARRSKKPTTEMIQEFDAARRVVYQTRDTLFSNVPSVYEVG
jgi:glycosyltransferase involved in cell wall biosynthesis